MQKPTILIEYLDSPIATVGDINSSRVRIHRDVECAWHQRRSGRQSLSGRSEQWQSAEIQAQGGRESEFPDRVTDTIRMGVA